MRVKINFTEDGDIYGFVKVFDNLGSYAGKKLISLKMETFMAFYVYVSAPV